MTSETLVFKRAAAIRAQVSFSFVCFIGVRVEFSFRLALLTNNKGTTFSAKKSTEGCHHVLKSSPSLQVIHQI